MKFDNKTIVPGIGRQVSREISSVLLKCKTLSDVVERWITTPTREVTFCNGIDEQNHFESLCMILKDEGKHVAERYLMPSTVHRKYPGVKPVSSFVNWHQYFRSDLRSTENDFEEHFDSAGYEKSIGYSDINFDEYLAVTVLDKTSGVAAALAHGLSPYCEATFSSFEGGFFEGDPATVKRWGKSKLFWLFTTLRPPHPVNGRYPELLESMVVDFSPNRATQRSGATRAQSSATYMH